jgi:hypothetical protein
LAAASRNDMFSVDSASLFMSTSTCVRRDLGYRVPAPLWLCWWAMAMALALALAAGMQGLRGAGVANVSSSSNLRCTMSTKRRQMVVVVMIVVVRDVRLQERKS